MRLSTIHSSALGYLNTHQITSQGILSNTKSTKAFHRSFFFDSYFFCSWRTMKILSVCPSLKWCSDDFQAPHKQIVRTPGPVGYGDCQLVAGFLLFFSGRVPSAARAYAMPWIQTACCQFLQSFSASLQSLFPDLNSVQNFSAYERVYTVFIIHTFQ